MHLLALTVAAIVSHAGPPTAPPDPLAGPAIAAKAEPSLVAREFDGRLRRLDIHPVEAALPILNLSDAERKAIDQIIRERTAIFDSVLQQNILLVQQLGSAGASGDKQEAVRLLMVIMGKLHPLTSRGPLELEIGRVLQPSQRKVLERLTKDYHNAVAADGLWEDGRVTRPGNRFETIAAERFRLFTVDAERSIKRILGQGEQDFEQLIAKLSLSPEQESRMRAQVQAFGERTGLNPTEGDQLRLGLVVFAWLDADQQAVLLRHMHEADGAKVGPTMRPAMDPGMAPAAEAGAPDGR